MNYVNKEMEAYHKFASDPKNVRKFALWLVGAKGFEDYMEKYDNMIDEDGRTQSIVNDMIDWNFPRDFITPDPETNMRKVQWHHVYSIGIVDEIEIPENFIIEDFYTKWGTLYLTSVDGGELEFSSDLIVDYDYKRPSSTTLEITKDGETFTLYSKGQ